MYSELTKLTGAEMRFYDPLMSRKPVSGSVNFKYKEVSQSQVRRF